MPMQINFRISDGAWVIAVYNPWGAIRGEVDAVGSVLDEDCTQNEVLTSQTPLGVLRVLYAWPESSAARVEEESVRITVGPGGLIVFALLPSA